MGWHALWGCGGDNQTNQVTRRATLGIAVYRSITRAQRAAIMSATHMGNAPTYLPLGGAAMIEYMGRRKKGLGVLTHARSTHG
jgi:hypothetical protein